MSKCNSVDKNEHEKLLFFFTICNESKSLLFKTIAILNVSESTRQTNNKRRP